MAPTSSSSAGPYSLPDKDEVELSVEDDWTRVKDRKEKKRIQNRVAQRSYRSRMKARLGELQSRLQAHEEQRAKEGSADGQFLHRTNDLITHATPPPSSHGATPSHDIDPNCISAASPPTPPDATIESDGVKAMDTFAPHQMYTTSADDNSWFMDVMPLMPHGDAPSYPLSSIPTPPGTMAQTPSPSMPTILQQGQQPPHNEGDANISQSIIQDCLRFQIQLLARMNSNLPENASPAQTEELLSSMGISPAHLHHAFDSDLQDSAAMKNLMYNNVNSPTTENSFSMPDFQNVDDILDLSSTNESSSITWKPTTVQPIGDASPSTSMTQTPNSLEERIEAAIENLESLGFSSLESFSEAYYTATFDETSPLAAEQRLSRKRRLPRLMANVLDAAQSWDPWERRGLNEEVLRTAESLLLDEGKNVDMKALESSFGGLLAATDNPGLQQRVLSAATAPTSVSQQNVAAIKKAMQDEVFTIIPTAFLRVPNFE
ncbi:hypothetical protein DCS_04395 [Drechmeria coniospora]|uniref:BZIP domain-containing protein n=1 Tax=Drechmeria coniospora TaxID=98403 RepID=A0A151GJX1_DRECN|nr:hypothetical protein DCS_04395 [Drechmeria coniospora]KYK57386.1 hypothetical protein DCS_04395 [Drechmeria coniospora]